MHPIASDDKNKVRKMVLYDIAFILAGLLGVILVVTMAYRTPREHAHFTFGTFPVYGSLGSASSWVSGNGDHRADFLQINDPLSFNVVYGNVGPGVAANVAYRKAAFIEPDMSPTSENDALDRFEKMKVSEPPAGSVTLANGDKEWVTAHGPIVSPEDYDNFVYGRRVVYVAVELTYRDDSGTHVRHYCGVLQPPEPGGVVIWAYCGAYNDEN